MKLSFYTSRRFPHRQSRFIELKDYRETAQLGTNPQGLSSDSGCRVLTGTGSLGFFTGDSDLTRHENSGL